MTRRLLSIMCLLIVYPTISMAGDAENELIDKVVSAYGGDAILNLENYRIEEYYLSPAVGQSHTPALTEIGKSAQVLTVDIKNNRAVFDNYFEGRGGLFQGTTMADGEIANTINFQAGTYGEAGSSDPHVFGGGTMRTSDTILVYELSKAKEQSKLLEDSVYMGRPHHLLSMPFPSSSELTLYVDSETFLISKMQRSNAVFGNLDYVYSNYQLSDGIKFASSTNFSIAGEPNLISVKRQLSFNQELNDQQFTLPEGLAKEDERIDTTEMKANKIGNNAYHVGQGNAYSLFVDTDMGTIGIGAYAGLEDRYHHYRKESENFKPFTYEVITHHHADHIGGIDAALNLGAKLVTVAENLETVSAAASKRPSSSDFYSVNKRATLGSGRNGVEIYEVSTIHAASFLLSYIPQSKTIFIADHFGSPFASGTPVAGQGTVDMLTAINKLGIDVKNIATAHNARIYTFKELEDSVAGYTPSVCSAGRPVCK